ncbi:TPA: DUF4870 domain-containing protein [Methanocaldococcus jannaschii]|nr:DUF4870 domain-containing protein [Methanocaldococcus jannaschii]
MGKTSLGLDENIEGALCYLFGVITGILFYILEKESKFVKFHAVQSIILFGGLWVLSIILAFIPYGWMLSGLVNLAAFILWIVCMYKAYKGEKFKLPVIGDIAEQYSQ